MIEIFRKGFRFDIKPDQVVTFKKSQNLNGIQDRYAYSNTVSMEKTANNKKLLELFDLPTNKVGSLMNGYEVDVVLNGSINLRNQTLKIQKENKETVETYLLYTDNALVVKLKETYINSVASGYTYKKTISDFLDKNVFVETQQKSGLYVIEEMPLLINAQELLRKVFTDNNYTVFGDFFEEGSQFSDYFVAPNKGIYEVYSGAGEGFAPSFDPVLDAFTFLNGILAYFNCYTDVDDTYKTVVVNRWTNLEAYKANYIDYSRFYVDYQDYLFQSKLAKRNELKYSDSGTAFDSFFANNLSSAEKATYLSSVFGTGTLNIFDDSKLEVGGNIPVRPNGAVGEISAVRMFKKSSLAITANVFVGGIATPVTNLQALPVSMQTIYTDFHKDYTDFILTPLVTNLIFRYDAIMTADFSLTKVFFVEQLSSYWIPLEINFSTKKDLITVKAMLIKKRKVESPVLYDFNSVLLDFKEKALFPLTNLLSMYPIPPNKYPWDIIIFKSYNQDLNRLYVNDVLITAASLPQAFNIADISTIKFEANKVTDTVADKNSASFYVQAIDTNGGVSNTAFINIKHTGVASLESNFKQEGIYSYVRAGFDTGSLKVSPNVYSQGLKPNLNTTLKHKALVDTSGSADDSFNLIQATEPYTKVKVDVKPFKLTMATDNNGLGRAKAVCQIAATVNNTIYTLVGKSVRNNSNEVFNIPAQSLTIPSVPSGAKIKVFAYFSFDNTRRLNAGSMDVNLSIENWEVAISTIKTV